jgi:predicted CXXCH cytochrome family protein
MMVALVFSAVLVQAGCRKKKDKPFYVPFEYVTSAACLDCHDQQHTDWMDSGHARMLSYVTGGIAPSYPYTSIPDPPSGFVWDNISYVIGGYFWKAYFLDTEGHIITGPAAGYNPACGSWSAFADTVAYPPGFDYNRCVSCHVTGWIESTSENQDNMSGIAGTWSEAGVGCEACHGPGGSHVEFPNWFNIIRDPNPSLCGKCHSRDSQNRIETKDGLIRNHVQYDELMTGAHYRLECIKCHDPHKTTVHGGGGLTMNANCNGCHGMMNRIVNHNPPLDCVDCHMPPVAKSAMSYGNGNQLHGDLHSHIFRIDITKDPADMFYSEDSKTYAYGFLTVNFACLRCHDGSILGPADVAEAKAAAALIHE